MAGNGDATQQLDKIERAITGLRQTVPRVAAELGADIMGMAEEQAQQAEAAAKYIMDHAQFLQEACLAHAQQVRAGAAHFADNLLAAEERKSAELRKLMGKLAG
jgi:phage host-nuclease inhibitor protein Gam